MLLVLFLLPTVAWSYYGEDQCGYDHDAYILTQESSTSKQSLVFTDGVYDYGSLTEASCDSQYAWKSINPQETSIKTLAIISDWRNSEKNIDHYEDYGADLKVYFTNINPSDNLSNAMSQAQFYIRIHPNRLTRVIDLTKISKYTDAINSKFLLVEFQCNLNEWSYDQECCNQIRIHQISCYAESLLNKDDFSSDDFSTIQKNILIKNQIRSNVRCDSEYEYFAGRTCLQADNYSLQARIAIFNVVSMHLVPVFTPSALPALVESIDVSFKNDTNIITRNVFTADNNPAKIMTYSWSQENTLTSFDFLYIKPKEPSSNNQYISSGVFFLQSEGVCDDDCYNSACYEITSDLYDRDFVTNEEITYTVTLALTSLGQHCIGKYKFSSTAEQDVDGMVTHIFSLNDQATTSKLIVVKCPDGASTGSFSSQVLNLKVQIHHLNFNEDRLFEQQALIINYNQCLSATFTFSTEESFLYTEVIHTAGILETKGTSLAPVSDSSYVNCNAYRVYTVSGIADIDDNEVNPLETIPSIGQDEKILTTLKSTTTEAMEIKVNINIQIRDYNNVSETSVFAQKTGYFTLIVNKCISTGNSFSEASGQEKTIQIRSDSQTYEFSNKFTYENCGDVRDQKFIYMEYNGIEIDQPSCVTQNDDWSLKFDCDTVQQFKVNYSEVNQADGSPDQFAFTSSYFLLINYVDECDKATLELSTWTDMTVTLQSEETQLLPDPINSILQRNSELSGFIEWKTCGKIIVEVNSKPDFLALSYQPEQLPITSNKITLAPQSAQDSATDYDVELKLYLESYPDNVILVVPFTILVEYCIVTSATTPSTAINSYTVVYSVLQQQGSTMIVPMNNQFDFIPACGYDQEYSFTVSPSLTQKQSQFISKPSLNPSELSISTRNRLNAGDYTITASLSLVNYPETNDYDFSVHDLTFQVQIIDECEITVVRPFSDVNNVQQLYSVIQDEPFIQFYEIENLSTTVQENLSLNPSGDSEICGPRMYQLYEDDELAGEYTANDFVKIVKIEDSSNQVSYGTQKNSFVGSHMIELRVSLADYSQDKVAYRTKEFNITFFQQTSDLSILEQEYTINQAEALILEVPALSFSPTLHQSSNPDTGANGVEMLIQIFVEKSDGSYIVLPDDFGSLDLENSLIIIETDQAQYIGNQRLVINYHGQDYLNGFNFTTGFIVNVKSGPASIFEFNYDIENTTTIVANMTLEEVNESNKNNITQSSTSSNNYQDFIQQQLRENPIYSVYNFIPKTQEQKDEQERLSEIEVYSKPINLIGQIEIIYDPPKALVPDDWKQIFIEEERSKLPEEQRESYDELSKQLLKVEFIKNSSDEEVKQQQDVIAKLESFTSSSVVIQLYFSEPDYISQGELKDQVEIKLMKSYFKMPQFNASPRKLLSTENYDESFITFTEDLPLMMEIQETKSLVQKAELAEAALEYQLLSNFILQFFMSGALSQLWNVFNTLQIIISLKLLLVDLPPNVKIVQDQLEAIINFQLVPKDTLYDNIMVPVFGFDSSEEKLKKARQKSAQKLLDGGESDEKDQGSSSSDFLGTDPLMNVLPMILIVLILICLIILVILCRKCMIGCRRRVKKFPKIENGLQLIYRKLVYNSILRAILETYLKMCIFFFIASQKTETYSFNGKLNLLTLVPIGVFCFVFPFYTTKFLVQKWHEQKIDTKEIRQSYDSLYIKIETEKGPKALAFNFLFLIRRLLFAYTIGSMTNNIVPQILTVDFMSMFLLGYYLIVFPMEDKLNNFIQIFNEIFVILAEISLFLFTNYVPDAVQKKQFGYFWIYCIGFNVFINLTMLIVKILHSIYVSIRSCLRKRKYKRDMKRKVVADRIRRATEKSDSSSSSSEDSSQEFSRITLEQAQLFCDPSFRSGYLDFLDVISRSDQDLMECFNIATHMRSLATTSVKLTAKTSKQKKSLALHQIISAPSQPRHKFGQLLSLDC